MIEKTIETRIFTTSDGRKFLSKKEAQKHLKKSVLSKLDSYEFNGYTYYKIKNRQDILVISQNFKLNKKLRDDMVTNYITPFLFIVDKNGENERIQKNKNSPPKELQDIYDFIEFVYEMEKTQFQQ